MNKNEMIEMKWKIRIKESIDEIEKETERKEENRLISERDRE